jgi:hypothetical protein
LTERLFRFALAVIIRCNPVGSRSLVLTISDLAFGIAFPFGPRGIAWDGSA